jgi:hypothetical protein
LPLSTELDRDLAMTEISLQCAALAKTVRDTVGSCAERIVTHYPSCGLTERQVAAALYHGLLNRAEFLDGARAQGRAPASHPAATGAP